MCTHVQRGWGIPADICTFLLAYAQEHSGIIVGTVLHAYTHAQSDLVTLLERDTCINACIHVQTVTKGLEHARECRHLHTHMQIGIGIYQGNRHTYMHKWIGAQQGKDTNIHTQGDWEI